MYVYAELADSPTLHCTSDHFLTGVTPQTAQEMGRVYVLGKGRL